jgi:hypothetical protein
MNKKTIIQLVIIIVFFSASGFVLYNGLFKKKTGTLPAQDFLTASGFDATATNLLPQGGELDFDRVLKKQNLQYGVISFPRLDPKEVGIPQEQLITAPASPVPQN